VFNDDDTKILGNSPECITAMKFWANMIHDLNVSPTSAESASFPGGSFQAGGVIAMTRLASWSTPGMHMFATFDWDVAALTVLPIIIIFFLAQRYFVRGIVMTGMNG